MGHLRTLLLFSGLLLPIAGTGCSTMLARAGKLTYRMSGSDVVNVMGQPDEKSGEGDTAEWDYRQGGDRCSMTLIRGTLLQPPRCTTQSERTAIQETAQLRDDPKKWDEAQDFEYGYAKWRLEQKEKIARDAAKQAPAKGGSSASAAPRR